MPQFVLALGSASGARTFAGLDAFTQGYIEAMFWTEEETELEGCTFADLAPEAFDEITADCREFQERNAANLEAAQGLGRDLAYLGHDYWLSRNGHGTGFWDRGLGGVGEELHQAAQRDGEVWAYRGDDDQVWVQ